MTILPFGNRVRKKLANSRIANITDSLKIRTINFNFYPATRRWINMDAVVCIFRREAEFVLEIGLDCPSNINFGDRLYLRSFLSASEFLHRVVIEFEAR